MSDQCSSRVTFASLSPGPEQVPGQLVAKVDRKYSSAASLVYVLKCAGNVFCTSSRYFHGDSATTKAGAFQSP